MAGLRTASSATVRRWASSAGVAAGFGVGSGATVVGVVGTGAAVVVKLHEADTALPSASLAPSPTLMVNVRPPANGRSGV